MSLGSYINTSILSLRNGYEVVKNKIEPCVNTAVSPLIYVVDKYFPGSVENSSKFTKVCALWCAVNALEMSFQSALGAKSMILLKGDGGLALLQHRLSKDLAGTIFYGICALNPVPGTAKIASAISFLFTYPEANYYTWQVTHKFNEIIAKPLFIPLSRGVEKVVTPLFKLLYHVTASLLSIMGRIKIPFNATWFAVGVLTLATIIYKVWKSMPKPPPPIHECPSCHQLF